MDGKKRRIQQMFVVVTVIGLLFAVGCATSKGTAQLSGEKIFRADKAFSDAKDGNASLNAKDALAVAEGKLAHAKDAFAKQNFEEAANLAEQAAVDADYAQAKSTTQKNLNIAEAIKKNNDALRQEIQRMSY
ncbi:MAG: DUF4398 domain-containing protein [Deltaproteobacteria bacterium]|uniref:DUF4398 domain-containing protein n=1 Tax=Candidatus Deferrimicrobium sp. TaxID=3060586 RepID=UPI002720C509|nr:DUF4398 domain-containing protein [Candidatus Deferrimicrobium sp.]MCR4309127.1 DUF4398 domain-containing protein [Deltaproteobacteria bacterium]MDO8738042.1 DUF4398 domain-containing protein [Candidatus Deferrimicrobium sp.]